mmetsp:Transcript_5838/g.13967  ORF Transcript_5838/g.13967 Transcript_5838/m.13967 type:complete len:294 (-) Transcript_5838:124-1005(-)
MSPTDGVALDLKIQRKGFGLVLLDERDALTVQVRYGVVDVLALRLGLEVRVTKPLAPVAKVRRDDKHGARVGEVLSEELSVSLLVLGGRHTNHYGHQSERMTPHDEVQEWELLLDRMLVLVMLQRKLLKVTLHAPQLVQQFGVEGYGAEWRGVVRHGPLGQGTLLQIHMVGGAEHKHTVNSLRVDIFPCPGCRLGGVLVPRVWADEGLGVHRRLRRLAQQAIELTTQRVRVCIVPAARVGGGSARHHSPKPSRPGSQPMTQKQHTRRTRTDAMATARYPLGPAPRQSQMVGGG